MSNLWTNNKNKKKLNYNFSKKTIERLSKDKVIIKNGDEQKKYSSKISNQTWNKLIK